MLEVPVRRSHQPMPFWPGSRRAASFWWRRLPRDRRSRPRRRMESDRKWTVNCPAALRRDWHRHGRWGHGARGEGTKVTYRQACPDHLHDLSLTRAYLSRSGPIARFGVRFPATFQDYAVIPHSVFTLHLHRVPSLARSRVVRASRVPRMLVFRIPSDSPVPRIQR